MFGCAPGGGPTTLLGGPLRSKAPQQTFPPASCPDGKPVPPASCPDGKPVQTAGRSRRQASVSTRILSDKPSLPVPGHSKPSLPNRANLLQTRYCAAAAPKAQPSLTHPKASTRPRHADAALSRTQPHSSALDTTPMPPRHRPVPPSCPNRPAPPRSSLFRHFFLSSSDLAARDWLPRTLAFTLSPNTPPSPLITTHTLTRSPAHTTHRSATNRLCPVPRRRRRHRDRTGHKKTPAPLKVRASVLPNNRRITSRSSRHSPWRPSERPDRRCRRGSSSRPKR